jgi:hypothetical protein
LLHKLSKLGYSVAHIDMLLMESVGLHEGEEEAHHRLAAQYQVIVAIKLKQIILVVDRKA